MIQWPVALDENNQVISIEEAPLHKQYKCLCCGQPMIARKGRHNAPHFSHGIDTTSCTYDNYLHFELEKLLFGRITMRDGIALFLRNGKQIDLCGFSKCEKECRVDSFIPDIYLVVDGVEYFIEICVTSPCSEEKIGSGRRIVEICTKKYESLKELASGDILPGGEYYTVTFYNFPLEGEAFKSPVAQSFPLKEPFRVHDDIQEDSVLKSEHIVIDTNLDVSVEKVRLKKPEVPQNVEVSTHGQWNLNMPIPPMYHYVLYPNGMDKIILADFNRVMLRMEPDAALELGISIADGQFSYEVGRRYAADKGLLPQEVLTDVELGFDMTAIKKWLGYQEIENK